MNTYSMTYVGVIVFLIGGIFNLAGTPIDNEAIETTITTIVQLIGAIVTVVGRYRHGDITLLGKKK